MGGCVAVFHRTQPRGGTHETHTTPILAALTEDVTTRYKGGAILGTGAFSVVVECTDTTTDETYACKIIPVQALMATADGPSLVGRVRNELAVLTYLAGHPNVVRLHDVFESATTLYIVQERCCGTLRDVIDAMAPVHEARAATMFRGILKAVIHCHQQGVLHRDVKPENFLKYRNRATHDAPTTVIKLADFGFARFFRRDEVVDELVGTPYFMAPEMVAADGRGYGPEVDAWACGVCLYNILSGAMPFPGRTSSAVFDALRGSRDANFSGAIWRVVSPDAINLVGRLLERDPQARLTANDAILHPWMRKHAPASASSSARGIKAGSSSRVFASPIDVATRAAVHGFIDAFKRGVEEPYTRLLEAADADKAATAWAAMRIGLAIADAILGEHADPDGPFFKGATTSLAEAAVAPSLQRMRATLPAVRSIDLIDACDADGLHRIAAWMHHVLSNPAACDVRAVTALPDETHVHLARRLFVTYEGPPAA